MLCPTHRISDTLRAARRSGPRERPRLRCLRCSVSRSVRFVRSAPSPPFPPWYRSPAFPWRSFMSVFLTRRWRGIVLASGILVALLSAVSGPTAQSAPAGPAPVTPNFDLGSQWTSAKVSKLVFDTSVTPHWLQAGDRFWYSYQTRDGRRFFLVDPLKKAKAPLFDHAKMAAQLTSITRQPYDAQHLPFSNIKFKNDNVFEFDVSVPRDAEIVTTKKKITTTQQDDDLVASDFSRKNDADDPQQQQQQGQRGAGPGGQRPAPRNRTLRFEYDMATASVRLD